MMHSAINPRQMSLCQFYGYSKGMFLYKAFHQQQMWRSQSELTAFKTKPKETIAINGQIEDMQSYFEEICETFAARKQAINQIISRAETSLQATANSRQQSNFQVLLDELQADVSQKLTHSNQDILRTTSILNEFVTKEVSLIEQTCKQEAETEKEIIQKIIHNSTRRVEQLKATIAKNERTSSQKIDNILKDKCSLLEKQLNSIRDNAARDKKQAHRHLKEMLKVLAEIEDACADRELKEQSLLAHIDKIQDE